MGLTGKQKKHLKKHLGKKSLANIAIDLGIQKKEIENYLKKIWRKKKYQKFISKENSGHRRGSELNLKKYFVQNWKIFAFLAFLVFAVYFNSLSNDFLSDDIAGIEENPQIKEINYFWKVPYFNFNLRSLIIFLTNKIFGLNPVFYRLPNILSHLGSTWIIFVLISFFFTSPVPLITASIFSVHPILTESITWISGGPYSLGAFFLLCSLLIYIWSIDNKKSKVYFVSIFLFLLALFISEKLVVFPLILLMYEFCLKRFKNNWRKLIPFWLIGGLWALRLTGLISSRVSSLETVHYQESGIENPLIQVPTAVTSYLQLIFWPKNLTFYHSEMFFTQTEYLLKLGGFILFLAITAFFLKKDRRIFFWLSFFIITLLPTLTPFRISWIVAERYVYLGALGVIVPIALAIKKIGEISKNQKLPYILLAFFLLTLSIRTVIRNTDWKNQDTLWLATDKTSPSSSQNHNNLGDLYARHGDLEKAVEEFKKAIELKPNYGDAYHNLANIYGQMGKNDLAIENYQKAISTNPNLWQSHQNLANIYHQQGKIDLVRQELEKALQINPDNQKLKEALLNLTP